MRTILTALFMTLATQVAACNFDLISIVGWKIEKDDDRSTSTRLVARLSVNYIYKAERSIRMLDARTSFEDILGKRIGWFPMERDIKLTRGSEYEEVGYWGPNTFERLLDMEPQDVIAKVCVKGVVYSDGAVEKF